MFKVVFHDCSFPRKLMFLSQSNGFSIYYRLLQGNVKPSTNPPDGITSARSPIARESLFTWTQIANSNY